MILTLAETSCLMQKSGLRHTKSELGATATSQGVIPNLQNWTTQWPCKFWSVDPSVGRCRSQFWFVWQPLGDWSWL